MDPQLMSLPEVQSKNRRIAAHREAQKSDVAFRRRVRKIVVQELNYHEVQLRKLLQPTLTSQLRAGTPDPHTSTTSASIACTLEDLRELRAVLHQLAIGDDLSDSHWKQHFSLAENKLSHNERKFLRCFSPTTMIAEVPRRTKSPVERAQQYEERQVSAISHHEDEQSRMMRSSSFVLRGDTSAKVDPPLFKRKLNDVPLSRVFRVAENGRRGEEARRCFTPVSPTKRSQQLDVFQAHKRAQVHPLNAAKENNNLALGMMQKNALRDAHRCLTQTLELLESQVTNEERDAILAITHCNIANCYRRSGKLVEALSHIHKCAEIEQSCLGEAAPSTIINLGALQLQMGDINAAVSTVENLQRALVSKKESGEHISRHLFALCEEHLNTCDLYNESIQQDELSTLSRFSPGTSQEFDDLSIANIEHESYNAIIEDILSRRRERRALSMSHVNVTGASHAEWRSVSPVTFEVQRHDHENDFLPPPASVRLGEVDMSSQQEPLTNNSNCVPQIPSDDAIAQDPVVESGLATPKPANSSTAPPRESENSSSHDEVDVAHSQDNLTVEKDDEGGNLEIETGSVAIA